MHRLQPVVKPSAKATPQPLQWLAALQRRLGAFQVGQDAAAQQVWGQEVTGFFQGGARAVPVQDHPAGKGNRGQARFRGGLARLAYSAQLLDDAVAAADETNATLAAHLADLQLRFESDGRGADAPARRFQHPRDYAAERRRQRRASRPDPRR